MAADPPPTARARSLPSVDRLATAVARAELSERRRRLLAGEDVEVAESALVAGARARLGPRQVRVHNATGVVLHTNLGRAPLPAAAQAAVLDAASGYSALELDLPSGQRTPRGRRAEALITALTGAEAALAVNNGAAAVLLATAALAGPGREVLVSRGELVEIGGGFRIADVVAQSGATLVEVGATNRTRAEDYLAAIGPATAAILRVHQSNFRMTGFVERPELEALVGSGVPVIDDLGSGAIRPVHGEPDVRSSLAAGAALVCCSGDKLLGGPQAGLLAGTAPAIEACRRHPLARALRIDKLSLAALEATLALHGAADGAGDIPALAMLAADGDELLARARRLAELTGGEIVDAVAPAGGGSLPLLELPGPAVAVDPGPGGAAGLATALRTGDPAVVARVHRGRVLLAVRTLSGAELTPVAEAVRAALGP